MNNKKVILAVVGVLTLIAGIVVGVLLVQQNQNIKEKAAPATNLSIIPVTQTKSRGDSVSFNVVMGTGDNQITAMDIVLSFNPQALEITSITKGAALANFTTELKNSYDNTGGKIYYSNFAVDKTKAVSGTGLTVLTIAGKVKSDAADGSYQLVFLSQTTAAGMNEGVNVLVAKNPGTLVVSGSQATATPTSTPNSTTSPTATSTPGATATPRPIPVTGISTPTLIFTGLGVFSLIILFTVSVI